MKSFFLSKIFLDYKFFKKENARDIQKNNTNQTWFWVEDPNCTFLRGDLYTWVPNIHPYNKACFCHHLSHSAYI